MAVGHRRVRIYFTKEGDARFLSHLDLMRTMERAIRRADLPVIFTEGMNPRVKMAFPTALPLGMESRLEVMEIGVEAGMTVAEVCRRLAEELPEGIRPFDGDVAFTGEKWRVAEILYEVRGESLPEEADLEAFRESETVLVRRRKREVDLRRLVTRLHREEDRLLLGIAWEDSGTARPEDVLGVLGDDFTGATATKLGMTFTTSLSETIEKQNDATGPDQRP
jgi:radical SAM-linked protein